MSNVINNPIPIVLQPDGTVVCNIPSRRAPVWGRGNRRVKFGHVRRGIMKEVWKVLPKAHKVELTYSDGPSLAWRGEASNICVSPECKTWLESHLTDLIETIKLRDSRQRSQP